MLQELKTFDGSNMSTNMHLNSFEDDDDPYGYGGNNNANSTGNIYEDVQDIVNGNGDDNNQLPNIYEDGLTVPENPKEDVKYTSPHNESLVRWMDNESSDDEVQTSNTENGAEDEGLRFYTDSDGTMSLSGASSVTDAEMDALKEEWSAGCVQRTISNVAYMRWRFQAKMADNPNLSLIVTSLAASVAYLYLMMLRFPMLEPTVNASRLSPVFHKPIPGVALNWKSFMVISFQIGYFLGKIPAVCLTSKLKPWSRLRSMIFVSVFSFVTMVAFFSLLPAIFEGVMLFLGAMVMASLFGIISQYLEGRQFTEIMVSFLSLTLMLGRPLADLLARMMSEKHVAPEKIPPIIGVMFLPICLLAMFVLDTVPPPTARDAGRRAERRPISYRVGWKFVNEYSFGILLTVISYTVICAFRNYREYFASDIYSHTLNRDLNSWHYVALEFPAAAIVFICISLLARIKNNRFAFFMIIGIVSFGAILIVVVT